MAVRPTIDVANQTNYLKYALTKSQELGLANDSQFLGLLNVLAACPDDHEVGQLVRERIAHAELEEPRLFRVPRMPSSRTS